MFTTFGSIRAEALICWESGRVNSEGEPWECQWQTASAALPHRCSTSPCQTHVSLYCSLNDEAEQMVDLLSDPRQDEVLMGVDEGIRYPWPDNNNEIANGLFRNYLRVLLATGVLLDDLERLLKIAQVGGDIRTALSVDAPLSVDRLQGFINNIGKHGAKEHTGVHCWNHHASLYFEDADVDPLELATFKVFDARTPLPRAPKRERTRPTTPAEFDALLMPRLVEVVDTVTAALRNADAHLNTVPVLTQLAGTFGACW